MPKRIEVQPGQRKNRLTIIAELPARVRSNGDPRRVLLCRCDCGKEKEILFQSFTVGRVQSCGCYQSEITAKGKYAKKHGCSSHPLFSVWRCMINRCYDKNHRAFKYYGAKGITVCDAWRKSPGEFIQWAISNGWHKGIQLDKDIKKGKIYSPENCLLVPPYVNLMNRSNSKKILCWNPSINY